MIYSDSSKSLLREQNNLTKYNFIAIGYEKLTVSGLTAQALTVPTETRYVEISVESSITATVPVRYLLLGPKTLPTTTNGLALRDGTFFDITGYQNIINLRVIEATAGTHVLHIQYYK